MDGARSKATVLNFQRQDQGFVPFELIVQTSTIITYYGNREQPAALPQANPQAISFEDIGHVEGLIRKISIFIACDIYISPKKFFAHTP